MLTVLVAAFKLDMVGIDRLEAFRPRRGVDSAFLPLGASPLVGHGGMLLGTGDWLLLGHLLAPPNIRKRKTEPSCTPFPTTASQPAYSLQPGGRANERSGPVHAAFVPTPFSPYTRIEVPLSCTIIHVSLRCKISSARAPCTVHPVLLASSKIKTARV